MTFLPIVERELRIAARRPGTYRTRWLAALGMMGVWVLLAAANRRMSAAELSKTQFIALGVLALGFCLLAGIFLTADCLSEEKREGTLGLLFLTDLRGYDVVLGKLIATSVHSVYGLLAMFPVLALPLLMGGVTVGEFWRVVLVLVATLFFSLSMGMFVSALVREARQAMAGTFLGLVVLAGALPALWWLGNAVLVVAPNRVMARPGTIGYGRFTTAARLAGSCGQAFSAARSGQTKSSLVG
ncbi:MAG: ABC transporter permease subunit [Verrucomicrobia bacterium]|nr:ABC transporter permease subunit [Verrucomicrobiota bacterium]